jgi:hypothetical protein
MRLNFSTDDDDDFGDDAFINGGERDIESIGVRA